MTEEPELRPISAEAVPKAIEKAKHYRLLSEPAEAESICRDILDIQPANQETMVVLVLALTDQFGSGGPGTAPDFFSDDFLRVVATSVEDGVTRYAFNDPFQITQGQLFEVDSLT